MTDAPEAFRRWIEQMCGTDPGLIVADGRWHRFNIAGTRHRSSKPGRYLLHDDERPTGHFMDWRDERTRHRWRGDAEVDSAGRAAIAERRRQRAQERQEGFDRAAVAAAAYWSKAVNGEDAAAHPYLIRKGIGSHGARVRNGGLLVPLYDAEDRLRSLQQIADDGSRLFWPGSAKEGCYAPIGDLAGAQPIVLCEGFSTGASIYEATGLPVLVCIDAGNMVAVARWAGHRWAERQFIVAGDDDWHLPERDPPLPNKGMESAHAAARLLGGRVVMPDMHGLVTAGGDDFNDMVREFGARAVAQVFLSSLVKDENVPPDESDALGFRISDWSTDRYEGDAPPIRWLCEGSIPLGVPALFAAMGGVGKSFMALDMALDVASEVVAGSGTRRILGGPVREHGSVVVLGAEDAKDSVHRRMAAIDTGGRRQAAHGRLFVVPLPEVGGPMTLIGGQSGEFMQTAKLEALMTQLASISDLKLIVLDPLQAFVTANITSDPAAGQYMWSAFARICAATGATLIACHHMRKEGSSTIETADQAREAIRGSTALIDGARATYALWAASTDETRRVCSEANVEYRPKRVVRGAVVKANDEHDWEIHTYLRGDSGLLSDAQDAGRRASQRATGLTERQAMEVLREIDARWNAGRPFSTSPNTSDRYIMPWLMHQCGVSRDLAKKQLDAWFGAGLVQSDERDAKRHVVGLRVARWPD